MMKKVAITVAPVSGGVTQLNVKQVARDIIECAKAGATVVHLHARDENGRLTDDLTVFRELADRVKEQADVIIQASAGAFSHLTLEQRCEVMFDERVEMTNLSLTSNNFGDTVKVILPQDLRFVAGKIVASDVFPEVEIFELSDFEAYKSIRREFDFKGPQLFNIGLGHMGKTPCTPAAVCAFADFVPNGAYWDFVEIGRQDFAMTALALALGADGVRVGLEDGSGLDGHTAQDNYPIVDRTAKLLEVMGTEPMSAAQVREKYGLTNKR